MVERGRKPGSDPRKVRNIVQVLVNHQEGVWIRQIAKEAKLHPSTTTKYVEGVLAPMVDITLLGSETGKTLLKVVKLKPIVVEKLEQGQKMSEILRFLELLNKSL
ncbi:MAG: hypothetical protein HY831_01380 [Candidatus Aenigmarchaeota archaeon]|nr:hypothetical protein [Candidatus Aenigmarchaeota archaeon]